mgnify:CR=1 FL=1
MFRKILNKYKNFSLPVKAAFWYTLCNFFNKGLSLLSTPIFTRLMSVEDYGTFVIFQSWFSIIIIFTSLNMFMSGYTKGLILYEKDRKKFSSSLLGLTTTLTIGLLIAYVINMDFFTNLFELSPYLMIFMFLELLFMPALEFWMAEQRFDYKYKNVIFVSAGMNFICLLVSVISVVIFKDKISARVISDVLSKVLFGLVIFVIIFKSGKKYYDKKYWNYSLKFNIPLLPHYLSNYVLSQSDRIMIAKMVGKVQSAYYSVSYSISNVLLLLVLALNNALTPFIYKSIKANKIKEINKIVTPSILLVGLISIFVMALAPEVVYVFAGNKYMEAVKVIPPVAASVYFIYIYSMFSNVEYYYQKNILIAFATTISAGLNLVLNYIFIKKYGYVAAGYTTFVCYILLSLLHFIFYKKIIKKELPGIKNIYNNTVILIVSIFIIFFMISMTYLYNSIFRYVVLLLSVLILIIFRKKIFEIYNGIKNSK